MTSVCPGCGGWFADPPDGATHRYMESSPGCWSTYGEVLAREYNAPAYFQSHRFTVDAYAVQHPGRPSPQSIQSVAVHLISLCLVLERGVLPAQATTALQTVVRHKEAFRWLEPPRSLGQLTVADVRDAGSADEHAARVRAWAESSWNAWTTHHGTVRSWLSAAGL